MNPLDKLIDGNMGAAHCLLGLTEPRNEELRDIIMPKVLECGIRGTDLYVLWSDISEKDYVIMAILCEKIPNDLLIDASSRQDYSGKRLLEQYMANNP